MGGGIWVSLRARFGRRKATKKFEERERLAFSKRVRSPAQVGPRESTRVRSARIDDIARLRRRGLQVDTHLGGGVGHGVAGSRAAVTAELDARCEVLRTFLFQNVYFLSARTFTRRYNITRTCSIFETFHETVS